MKLLTHLFAGLVLALLGLAGLRLWTPSSEKKRGEGDPSGTKPGEVDHDRNFFNGSACLLQLPFANRSRSGDDVARRRSKDIVHSLMVYVYQAHSYQLVTATHEYIGLCLGLFPKGVPMAPSRQPFDGAQWNKREIKIQRYAERHGEVYVVVGTSLESDGTLPEDVEVPSMFWSAVYDPRSSAAVAWACRNGLREKDGGCYCADDLSARELESVVGIRPFPGVDTARMLSDF